MEAETGAPALPARFIPKDEAQDRAAVGHLAQALQHLTDAIVAGQHAGWGKSIRGDILVAQQLVGYIVEGLA